MTSISAFSHKIIKWYISSGSQFKKKMIESSFTGTLLKLTFFLIFSYFHLQEEAQATDERSKLTSLCGKSERLCLGCFSSSHNWHLPHACKSRRCEAPWESFHHSDADVPGHWIGTGPSRRPDPFQVSEGKGSSKKMSYKMTFFVHHDTVTEMKWTPTII